MVKKYIEKVHTLKENGTDTDVVAASGKKAKRYCWVKKGQ